MEKHSFYMGTTDFIRISASQNKDQRRRTTVSVGLLHPRYLENDSEKAVLMRGCRKYATVADDFVSDILKLSVPP